MARVQVEGLAKRFPDGTVAVDALSLAAPDGELLVIMGPSGCGKSTLLRLIAGLEAPSAGRVLLDGVDVTALAPAKRDMAMVFQAYALYPHMTVAENLAFPLRMRRIPAADRDRQVRAVAQQLGLGRLLDRRPRDLSGGEQQRVALGRALIRRPKLFLLDEPLSNLDASLRADVREEIRRLHASTGTTMLYVTHDQQEALTLAQRLAIVRAGALVQTGTPADLYARPATLAVARALGHPPINTVGGDLSSAGGMPRLRTRNGELPLPAWAATANLPTHMTLAVRPEHLSLCAGDATAPAAIDACVLRVEGAGPDRLAWLDYAGAQWAMRWPADTPEPPPESTLRVGLAMDDAHLFDSATGASLRPGPRGHSRAVAD